MIEAEDFYPQHGSVSNEELGWYICGIACIAMVLESLDKFDEFRTNDRSLEPFLKWLVGLHVNGEVPVVQRRFVLNGEAVWITVGLEDRVERRAGDRVATGEKEYFPVFSLQNGYDHRASEFIFEKFGLKAGLLEDYSFDRLVADIRKGKYRYFLASVHSFKGRGSHLVVVQNVGEDAKGKYIEIVDPSEVNYKFGLKRLDFEYFEKIYNGFGTMWCDAA